MTKVVRYFHIRTGTKGGATVCVKGDTDFPSQVDVQYSLCSRKDNFIKAMGRSLAEKAPTKIVPLRYLPQELQRVADKAKSRLRGDFTYAIKYFLPKE
jgi:hypothetical protein